MHDCSNATTDQVETDARSLRLTGTGRDKTAELSWGRPNSEGLQEGEDEPQSEADLDPFSYFTVTDSGNPNDPFSSAFARANAAMV